jgi:HlyD family secretion protein
MFMDPAPAVTAAAGAADGPRSSRQARVIACAGARQARMAASEQIAETLADPVAKTIGLDREAGGARSATGRWWIGGGALLIAALAAAILWWSRDAAPLYVTAPVERGPLVVEVTATGTLQPLTLVEVGAEISGRVARVEVDYNDRVEAGAVLAVLDTEQLEARVVQARANLAVARALEREAQATLEEARNRERRARELAREETFSQQDLEVAVAALARAEAGLASARAQEELTHAALEADEVTLAKAVIRSPIRGVVISRDVEPGQTLAATFQTPVLFTIAEDLGRMRLHVDVDEADVGQVAPGQPARFRVDAYPQRDFEAVVQMVRNAAREVQGVVTYEALLSVVNPDLALRPGMTATARIVTAELANTLLVPNGALRFAPPAHATGGDAAPVTAGSDTGPRVWTLRGGVPVAVPVQVGLSDGRRSQLVSGELEVGTQLLVDVSREARDRDGAGS